MGKDLIIHLRKIHGNWYEWRLDKKKRIKILWNVVKHKNIIVGTPEHGNLGDNAIVLGMYAFLEDCGISANQIYEITYSEYELIKDDLGRFRWKNKLVLGVGGGNFGDLWYNEQELRESFIHTFRRCPIIIFPQTVFYSDYNIANSMKRIIGETFKICMCAREEASYDIMQQLFEKEGAKILEVPDIVLYMNKEWFGLTGNFKRESVLLCMRQDKEKAIDDFVIKRLEEILCTTGVDYYFSDTVVETRTNKVNRKAVVQEKLKEFASARLIITDRLHGMVFAAIAGTPCLVFGNNHHKVEGTYRLISYLPYIRFVDDPIKVDEYIRELLLMKQQTYVRNDLSVYYDQLREILQNAMEKDKKWI